jgi:hypothetical protein
MLLLAVNCELQQVESALGQPIRLKSRHNVQRSKMERQTVEDAMWSSLLSEF